MRNRNLKTAWMVLTAAIILLQLAVSAHAGYRIEYEYDSLDRLVKVTHPAGETVNYAYDTVGNRIRKVSAVNTAPIVLDFVIENGQTQRSTIKTISAQFSEDVTVDPNALSIAGLSNGVIDLTGSVFDYNSISFIATWALPQSLPDDSYTATLDASKITDSGGKNLDGNGDGVDGDNALFTFHRLFGDSTGDGKVNYEDLFYMANRWLSIPNNTGLDNNNDNLINFDDFAAFAYNWNKAFSPLSIYPTVIADIIASGQTQRSMIKDIGVQFSRNVSVDSDALSITGQSTGPVNLTSAIFNYNPSNFAANWALPDSLLDDKFTATIAAAKVIDSQGYRLDGNNDGTMGDDHTFNLHRFFGDTTGDAVVNYEDLLRLTSCWLNTPADTGLDVDGSNFIDFEDFAFFANNWLNSY